MSDNRKPLDIVKKNEARLAAIKALYASEIEGDSKDSSSLVLDMITYYHEDNKDYPLNEKFLVKLVEGVLAHKDELDFFIKGDLGKNWSIERIGTVMRAILRLAVFELKYLQDIPYKVVINEYLDVSRGYCDESEVKFINGILDKISHKVRDCE